MSLKVDDVNFRLRNVTDDDFFIINLSKEVNDIFVLPFEENFARCITMDYALFRSRVIHSGKHKGIFVSGRSHEDLWELSWKLDSVLVS